MDASIGWQKVVQDLAGDNEEIREQLREITGWFPSIEMMRNHARGLIKVMREDEAQPSPAIASHLPPPSLGDEGGAYHHRRSAQGGGCTAIEDDDIAAGSLHARLRPPAALDPVDWIPSLHRGNNKKKRETKKPVVVWCRLERIKNQEQSSVPP
ncbi:hypothetical protein ZWY2020_011508 [Hordeum vulgare]|nr:hypothetical protein ZWY2020_011508 [Hordeum vulgare]